MATTVSQSYSPSQNVSITRKGGHIVLVTLWVTGNPATETRREV